MVGPAGRVFSNIFTLFPCVLYGENRYPDPRTVRMCFRKLRIVSSFCLSQATCTSTVRVETSGLIIPDFLQQLISRKHLTPVIDQIAQQVQLLTGKAHRHAVLQDLGLLEIDLTAPNWNRSAGVRLSLCTLRISASTRASSSEGSKGLVR